MATATIPTTDTTEEAPIARLRAEMDRRPINRFRLARDMGMRNPYYIYKILDGTRPAPADFIELVCGLTGIPLYKVLSPDDYKAMRGALDLDAYEENLTRMGMGY